MAAKVGIVFGMEGGEGEIQLRPCVSSSGTSQNHDYIWYYGWCNEFAVPDCAGGRVDFSTNPPQAASQRRPINMMSYGHIMADSLGEEVLYYSHGRRIFNRLDAIMENGDTINPGYWWHLSAPDPYISPLSGLSVSYPGRHAEYLYFHQRNDTLRAFPVCCLFTRDIYFSHIDMSANDGLGKVVETSTVSSEFTAGFGMTKMGGNQGWWLAFGLLNSNVYHVYAVDSAGVHFHRSDTLGPNLYPYPSEYVTERPRGSLFSPDGSKFARNDEFHGITVLDFDRCTGQLSNPRFYPRHFVNTFTSMAFSPNSRFLYFNNSGQVMQLDTWAGPDENPLDTIANWDAYYELNTPPFADTFAFSQLAPDGKIYISASASSRHFHVIERPDLLGQACGLRQHAFPLPTSNGTTIPRFPNYRLPPIDCE